jgi:hypothetical protein
MKKKLIKFQLSGPQYFTKQGQMIKYICLLLLIPFITASVKFNKPEKELNRIWVIDDGEKIRQDDINNPLATSPLNPVWNGKRINLSGARNEIIAFQIILQADARGADNVDIKFKELINKSFTISNSGAKSADPYDYRGKSIELFTEHYVEVTQRTQPGWFYHPNAKPSDYYLGWVPDPLIPFEAPSGKGGTPFSIKANMNQAVWVDIWIPKDAPRGLYKGNIQVYIDKKEFRTIPVELNVFNFMLPDQSHAQNMFFLDPSDLTSMHGVTNKSAEYWNVETKYRQMAHRHRMDIVTSVPDLKEMDSYHKKYLTGEMYSPANNYDGPCTGVGNTTFSIGIYGGLPKEYSWSEEGWQNGSDAWAIWFKNNAPNVQIHKYLFPDEPDYHGPKGAKGTGSMDTIRMQANWTHNNPGMGRNIPTFVTIAINKNLKGYVDFWSTGSHQIFPPFTSMADHESQVASGKKWGFYNGFRPSAGSVVIDADAIEFRVQPWIMWKYKADQYFYWRTTHWKNVDVYVNALNFLGNAKANGDGNMFYPGQDKKYSSSDRGLPGPIASIRIKNWRRGAQDFEYLWLLKQAGLEKDAQVIADRAIPRALFDTDVKKDISWSNHGYGFEKYRMQMAELLESATLK